MKQQKEVQAQVTVRVLSTAKDKQVQVKTLNLPSIAPQVSSWSKATSALQ
jgi:hypothetical protein